MPREFPESDWKTLRRFHPVALDRFCGRVLSEIQQISSNESIDSHERFLKISALVRNRVGEMTHAFDDMRRSRAIQRIASIHYLGLFTEQELAEFSPETRDTVQFLVEMEKE
jgi:hypothetical protein